MCISVLFSLTWSISDSPEPNPLLTSALGIGGNFGKKIVKFSPSFSPYELLTYQYTSYQNVSKEVHISHTKRF